jgi:hypothetical protein
MYHRRQRYFAPVKTHAILIAGPTAGEADVADAWRQTRLDHAITAVILGFFGSAWFGWAHGGVTGAGAGWLDAGSALSALVAVAALVTAFRVPRERSAMARPADNRRYGVIVGIETVLIVAGAVGLGASGHPRWIAVWVLAVVGVHFVPLARPLHNRALYPLGALVCAAAVTALVVGLVSTVDPVGIAGTGGGVLLAGCAVYDLALALGPTR